MKQNLMKFLSLRGSDIQPETKIDISPTSKIGDTDAITFTYIEPSSSGSFKTSKYSHLWGHLGFYTNEQATGLNITRNNGGVLGTFLNDLPDAFLSNGAVFFQIPNDQYKISPSGNDFRLKISLTGTTTATTLYSSFINDMSKTIKVTNSVCSGVVADNLTSDNSDIYDKYGIGYSKSVCNDLDGCNLTGYYESGVVGLMSNDAEFTGTTTGLTSWSYAFGSTNKYANKARMIEPYPVSSLGISGTSVSDRLAGLFFPSQGIGFITYPDFVSNFDWASATGGTGTTEATFSTSDVACEGHDIDSQTTANMTLVVPQEIANTSINPSWRESVDLEGNCGVVPTTLYFYD